MTRAEIIAEAKDWLLILGHFLAAVGGIGYLFIHRKIDIVHKQTNSLVALLMSQERAAGKQEGLDQAHAEQKDKEKGLTP